MDDRLKYRLAGAGVALGATLLVSLLLPTPGEHRNADDVQRVTIDLNAPVPVPVAAPSSTTVPPVIAAPASSPADMATAPDADDDAQESQVEDPSATGTDVERPVQAEKIEKPKNPTRSASPAAKPVAPGSAAIPASGKGLWFVQAGAFADAAHAHETVDKLRSHGFKVIISPAESRDGTLYRVRIGPYRDREHARAAQAGMARLGYPKSALVGE